MIRTKTITFRVPENLHNHIKKIAQKENKMISKILMERLCKSFGVKYIPEQVIITK